MNLSKCFGKCPCYCLCQMFVSDWYTMLYFCTCPQLKFDLPFSPQICFVLKTTVPETLNGISLFLYPLLLNHTSNLKVRPLYPQSFQWSGRVIILPQPQTKPQPYPLNAASSVFYNDALWQQRKPWEQLSQCVYSGSISGSIFMLSIIQLVASPRGCTAWRGVGLLELCNVRERWRTMAKEKKTGRKWGGMKQVK